ncbi:hypothetical protein ACFW04_008282 [Cataglyphis niger]
MFGRTCNDVLVYKCSACILCRVLSIHIFDMATSAAVHLLTAWGFSEEIIGRFTTQQYIENVDPNNQSQAIQQDLDTNHVPIKKQKKDSKQNEDNEINEDNISITENISPIPSTSSTSTEYDKINAATDNKYNLESIFKKSEGQLLLSLYKNEGKLNNDQRNKLAKIIVSNKFLVCVCV